MASFPTELSSSSSNRKLVLAGQIAFLPTGILQTLLGPMLPILIARWAINDTQAGNLFLVQFLASLAGVQLSAVLLARWGFRPAFLLGLLLMAGGVATIYMGSLGLGLASVATYGLGLGLLVPSDNLLIAEIGSGSSASAGAGSRAHKLLPFFLGAVAVFLLLLALAMRNLSFPAAAKSEESALSWRDLVKSPAIWIFAAIFFLYPGAEAAVGGWVGSYVARLGSHGLEIASMMPAFFYSTLTVGRALGTAFLHHFSERNVLRAGYAAGAAGIALMLWAPALAGVIAGALITGLSFSTLYPIAVAQLSQRFGVAARSIGAVVFSLASVGPAVIPWMVGVISHATGSLRAGLLLPLAATVILFFIHLFEW
jgi:FHS family glucose/mannose:H+ symporter-like MFS transporter